MIEGLVQHDHPLTLQHVVERMRRCPRLERGRTSSTTPRTGLLKPEYLAPLIESEQVTVCAAVPTVWADNAALARAQRCRPVEHPPHNLRWRRRAQLVDAGVRGAIDANGFIRITDRAKDVIKSGGEWISSVELEGELMAHTEVAEAAVIARPDERWQERPLACVVRSPARHTI